MNRQSLLRKSATPPTAPFLSGCETFLATLLFVLVAAFVFYRSNALPEPLALNAPLDVFSEARSRVHLNDIVALGEQRTVGSITNEIKTPNYIREQVAHIQNSTGANIETVTQFGSGSFGLPSAGEYFTSVYANIQNVLVMLHSQDKPPSEGVLMISAHFDGPVGTIGASDNVANVANMLEILRVLAHEHRSLSRSVLFIFNGAEETSLQGSHLFSVSGHEWVKYVKAFINLEAAGSGGRELMFQATSNSMTRAWARASPHPHGSIVGQDVFQSDIIPSDTDFRVYLAELGVPGMDWASIENGHVYHTALDTADYITPGAMQRYGENILATTKELLSDDEFWASSSESAPQDQELLVFFDVLGYFVVVIPPGALYAIAGLGAVSLAAFFKSVYDARIVHDLEMQVLRAVGMRMVQLLIGCLIYPLVVATAVHVLSPLAFYSQPWLINALYFAPALYGVVSCMATSDVIQTAPDAEFLLRKELIFFTLSIAIWTLLAAVLLLNGKGSAYVCMSWVLFPVLLRMKCPSWRLRQEMPDFPSKDERFRCMKVSALSGAVLGSIVPLLLTFPLVLVIIKFFLPVTGRAGSRIPGDAIVALVCGLSTFVLALVPSSVMLLLPQRHIESLQRVLKLVVLSGLVYIAVLRVLHGQGASSFSALFPKRVYVLHVDSLPHQGTPESFLWVVGADSSPTDGVLAEVRRTEPFFEMGDVQNVNCDEMVDDIYCDLPWYFPLRQAVPTSKIIPATVRTEASDSERCKMELKSIGDSDASSDLRRLHFCLHGSERSNIFFKDGERGGPRHWSFDAPLISAGGDLYITIANGKPLQDGNCFWVDAPKETPLKVAWSCFYLEEEKPTELSRFVSALPDWVTPVSFVSKWRSAEYN